MKIVVTEVHEYEVPDLLADTVRQAFKAKDLDHVCELVADINYRVGSEVITTIDATLQDGKKTATLKNQ